MSKTAFRIRRATFNDANDFVQLVCALARFENLPPPDQEAQARLIDDGFSDRPRFESYLAFEEGTRKPVGYAIWIETYSTFLARPSLYLEDIFILPEFRNHGIGTAFMDLGIRLARERDYGRVEWTCLDWNVRAQTFYEKRLGALRRGEWLLYRMTRNEMDSWVSKTSSTELVSPQSPAPT